MAPLPALLALAALLLAGNLALGAAWLGQRDRATRAVADAAALRAERDGARAAAGACSDAVQGLRTRADQRHAAAAPARAAAASAAQRHQQRADHTLAQAPQHTGDACASLRALGDGWLAARMPGGAAP